MDSNRKPEQESALDKVLGQWVVDAPLPPRFQEHVWKRIARGENHSAWTLGSALVRLVDSVLPRPTVAFSYLAVLLALGVVAGGWAAQHKNDRLGAALESRYLQTIDPLQRLPAP